ncbi:MAG: cupin domain-containing protein [Planctomycetota bacterium]|nr:MAG: cupin domain-containing protein [Planctomycetota bacterium]
MKPEDRIVHETDLDWMEIQPGGDFHMRMKRLGPAAGSQHLGCTMYELPPGGKAWPFHYHHGIEEAIFVLEGSGTLRLGDRRQTVTPGTFVALPVGEDSAHQMLNEGQEVLRYLCLSTMQDPDLTIYPDSNKVGLFAGRAPGGDGDRPAMLTFLDLSAEKGYWQGEVPSEDA